jgi:DNA-binding MurR/RpiR family transcriptional regulator
MKVVAYRCSVDYSRSTQLEQRLTDRFSDLSPTEQRVARFFADHREEVGFVSAIEIAHQLGTSDATVVRTAQRLGYAGLPELKRELLEALRERATPALRLGRRLQELGDEPADILDQVLSWHIELIEEARRTLRPDAFGRAIEILAAADRTLTFGIGPSASLADYMTLKLIRYGRQAASVSATGMGLADSLLSMRRGDALVLMDFGRVSREVEVTLDRANEVGVPVILLTDTLAFELAGRIEVALQAPRGRSGELGSVVSTMVLLEALLLGLANHDRGPTLSALEALNDLRAQILGYRVDVLDVDPSLIEGRTP